MLYRPLALVLFLFRLFAQIDMHGLFLIPRKLHDRHIQRTSICCARAFTTDMAGSLSFSIRRGSPPAFRLLPTAYRYSLFRRVGIIAVPLIHDLVDTGQPVQFFHDGYALHFIVGTFYPNPQSRLSPPDEHRRIDNSAIQLWIMEKQAFFQTNSRKTPAA